MIIEYNISKKQVTLWSSKKIHYYGIIGKIHRIETSLLNNTEHRIYDKENELVSILHGRIKTIARSIPKGV